MCAGQTAFVPRLPPALTSASELPPPPPSAYFMPCSTPLLCNLRLCILVKRNVCAKRSKHATMCRRHKPDRPSLALLSLPSGGKLPRLLAAVASQLRHLHLLAVIRGAFQQRRHQGQVACRLQGTAKG